jgi:phosphatidate cytidylyltransferase
VKQDIAIQFLWTLGVIFGVAVAGLAVNWAIKGKGQSQSRMGMRFLVEVFVLAGVFVPTYMGGAWLLAAAVVLGCICAGELYGTFEFGGDMPWKLAGILIGLFLMLYCYANPGSVGRIFPYVLGLYWVLRIVGGKSTTSIVAQAKRTCFGILYPFLCLAFFVEIGNSEAGFGYVILYYGLAEVNDSAAYLVGSSIGKRKIFPKLSPNKTVEGVVGGVATTVLIAFVLWFAVPDLSGWRLAGAGVLIAIAGLAGDLFASRLKRRVGVKDYGEAVPTQGGVLDVYDAFIFVAPVFYYYLLLTGG